MTKYANLSIEYLPMSFFRCLIAFSFSNSSFIITCSHMPHVKQNYHVNWGNTTIFSLIDELTTFYTNYTCSIIVLALEEPKVFSRMWWLSAAGLFWGLPCICAFFATDAVSTHIWTVWHHLIHLKLLFFKTMLFVRILPWHGLRNVTLYTCIYSPVSSVMTQEWRIWAMIKSGSSKNAIFQSWLKEYQYR